MLGDHNGSDRYTCVHMVSIGHPGRWWSKELYRQTTTKNVVGIMNHTHTKNMIIIFSSERTDY